MYMFICAYGSKIMKYVIETKEKKACWIALIEKKPLKRKCIKNALIEKNAVLAY